MGWVWALGLAWERFGVVFGLSGVGTVLMDNLLWRTTSGGENFGIFLQRRADGIRRKEYRHIFAEHCPALQVVKSKVNGNGHLDM